MVEESGEEQLTLKAFMRRVVNQASQLSQRIDPNKRFQQEKVQMVILTTTTAILCILGAYVFYA